ncbi:MAG: DUF3137 domain-containing protein [Bacteroidetes bacterium]|nr:DUF3137 domain-containing protein [Bacteroidota bacterium]
MENLEKLEALYEHKIKPEVLKLEAERKRLKKITAIAIVCFVVPFAFAFLSVFHFRKNYHSLTPDFFSGISVIYTGFGLAFITFIIGIVLILTNNKRTKKFKLTYKQKVVGQIIKSLEPHWRYLAERHIAARVFDKSQLSSRSYDRFHGDDLIVGQIDKTAFECCEIHTEYKTESTDSNGHKSTSYHTIFQGLFFHADFNKEFNGITRILPDTAEKLGWLGKWTQKTFGGKQLVQLEDPEFEREFVVFSTDQIEARYILTPAMMEAMVKVKKSIGKRVAFSLVDTRLYSTIHFGKPLFEPSIWKTNDDFEQVKFIYELFQINRLIIQELNLNTRIWTKE